MTKYAGIDYSCGLNVNKDNESNIRYGVISIREVCQAWGDNSEAYYGEGWEDSEDEDDYFAEPISFYIDNEEYLAEQSQDDSDIFIMKSPYFTYAQFCSPCAPGACHLENPLDDDAKTENNKCYCFGHDWFDEGKAPYKVYSVKTGLEVLPE